MLKTIYTAALRKQYGKLQQFAPTGKRGRPRIPKLIVDDLLKYAQVIKMRVNGRLNKVIKRIIFGKNVDPKMISTSYMSMAVQKVLNHSGIKVLTSTTFALARNERGDAETRGVYRYEGFIPPGIEHIRDIQDHRIQ